MERIRFEFFTMPGCPNCLSMEKILNSLQLEYSNMDLEEINLIDYPEEASRYGIMACPVLAINGKVAFVGGAKEKDIRQYVEALA